MYIENIDTLLKRPIIGRDTQMWVVCECSRLADVDTGPYYEFTFITQVPVKSSPNQQFYHYTKQRVEKAQLTLMRHQHENMFELRCNGQSIWGPISDINTADKFIIRIIDMLPLC